MIISFAAVAADSRINYDILYFFIETGVKYVTAFEFQRLLERNRQSGYEL